MDVDSQKFKNLRELCEHLIATDARTVVVAYAEEGVKTHDGIEGWPVGFHYIGSLPEAVGLTEMIRAMLHEEVLNNYFEDEDPDDA